MPLPFKLSAELNKIDVLSSPRKYIERILQAICDCLGYRFGSIIEIDDQGKGFILSSYNLPQDYPEQAGKVEAPLLSSPSGEAIETGKIVVLRNSLTDLRMSPWYKILLPYNIKTMIWVPLLSGDHVFGTYVLYDTKIRDVSEEELQTLEQIAMMISIAIVSNQYLDQLTQKTKKLEQEIVERKQVETALWESEKRFRIAAESASDLIYEWDIAADHLEWFGDIDGALGFESEELPRTFEAQMSLIHPDDQGRLAKAVRHRRESGDSPDVEYSIRRKDGSWLYWTDRGAVILDETGKPSKLIGVCSDITKTKQLQDQLIRSERLAATGQLAASVAHEINSPLQGITSLISVIKKSHDKDAELLENIKLIEDGFKRVRDTVKNLLDLNRPRKERKQFVNINAVINGTLSLIKVYLEKNKIKIDLDLSTKVPDILASQQQLGHVFMNLINNAVEAMTDDCKGEGWNQRIAVGGEIRINTRLRKEEVIIEVADTGPGISKKDIGNIFDSFYTRKKAMGIGIGLSICHDIIEDHKGSILAKNLPEGGTVFTITLPVH